MKYKYSHPSIVPSKLIGVVAGNEYEVEIIKDKVVFINIKLEMSKEDLDTYFIKVD